MENPAKGPGTAKVPFLFAAGPETAAPAGWVVVDEIQRLPNLLNEVHRHIEDRRAVLGSYARLYLREEVRAEGLVRNLPGFARFLPIAALHHGQVVNISGIARDRGVAGLDRIPRYAFRPAPGGANAWTRRRP